MTCTKPLRSLTFVLVVVSILICFIDEISATNLNVVKWVPKEEGEVAYLEHAGAQTDFQRLRNLYIGRVNFLGGVISGKVTSDNEAIWFGYKGKELQRNSGYELLVYAPGALKWVQITKASPALPTTIFQAGTEPLTGSPLYVCRAWHDDHLVNGNLNSVKGNYCNISYGFIEHSYYNFDVLVTNMDIVFEFENDVRKPKPSAESSANKNNAKESSQSLATTMFIVLAVVVTLGWGAGMGLLCYKKQYSVQDFKRFATGFVPQRDANS